MDLTTLLQIKPNRLFYQTKEKPVILSIPENKKGNTTDILFLVKLL